MIDGFLTGGNRHDIAVAEELTSEIVGCYVLQDRAYDSNKNRSHLEACNNIAVIPGRKNRKTAIIYDEEKYKIRGTIERFFGKLKENRRLAMSFEKDDRSFLTFIALASTKIHLC